MRGCLAGAAELRCKSGIKSRIPSLSDMVEQEKQPDYDRRQKRYPVQPWYVCMHETMFKICTAWYGVTNWIVTYRMAL